MISPSFTGNGRNLPSNLSDKIGLDKARTAVYWSAPNPSQPIQKGVFCQTAGPLIVLPCFWPHLVLLSIPFCCMASLEKQHVLNHRVVVTEKSVEVVNLFAAFQVSTERDTH